jgi:hypothetical protein
MTPLLLLLLPYTYDEVNRSVREKEEELNRSSKIIIH